ncbi:DUF1015 domain-containing protein [bacterium]|nr:DUF1015 domain-containing protein [bacterium]
MEIKPINAIIYNQDKVDMEAVIAPPYDVIGSEYQKELYGRSPYNFVRLILSNEEDRYKSAKRDFDAWLKEGVLKETEKPCILYIVQNYVTENGRKVSRRGFIARNKIETFESGKVLPHEFTMGGPKADRLNLMSEVQANLSQVFMVYEDKEQTIDKVVGEKVMQTKPLIDTTDDKGVQNLVWIVDDEKDIELIQKNMEDKILLIADGHHRYETAMNYSKINTNPEAQYVMSYFTNLSDDNLIIFPTHRIITKWVEPYVLLEGVKKYYDIEEIIFNSENKKELKAKFLARIEEENQKQITTGLYMKNVNKFFILKLKPEALEEVDAPDVLKKLDLTVLHQLIITKELGYTKEEQMGQVGIKYLKQEAEAFEAIDMGTAEASFIMAYPKMQDIREISGAGYKMPQKSTYFYPKLLSGVVINPLWQR